MEEEEKRIYMVNIPSDSDLIIELQAGNLNALGFLYDRHKDMVYRTASMITGDPEAAADLLHDVFLRLHRFSSHVDSDRPLEPWLYRMTVNQAHTWVKRSRRFLRPLEEVTEWLVGIKRQPHQTQDHENDDWAQVQQAVSVLPMNQRIVVVLYYLNDLSLQEISEITNVPVGTVKSRLYYGRESLKKSLNGSKNERFSDLQCEFT
jgi:RNA polymerase sigma-70 factor, ECF subfamily